MSNNFLNVQVESDFTYKGGLGAAQDGAESMEAIVEALEEEVLMYQMYFQEGSWLDSEIEHICNELIQTGQMFAKNQGFGEGLSIGKRGSGRKYIKRTGALLKGFRATPISGGKGGKSIDFRNVAQNERGEYYAGHLEYGFHDRGGNFIPARPFMRPAMYAVAEGSKGNFNNILRGLLENLWTGKGFRGVSDLSFGRKSAHRGTNFWGNKNFSKQLSKKPDMKNLKGDRHRKWMSTKRQPTPRKQKGYKLAANRREFQRMRDRHVFSYKPKTTSNSKQSSHKTEKQITSSKSKEGKNIGGVHYKTFKQYANSVHKGDYRKAKSIWREH